VLAFAFASALSLLSLFDRVYFARPTASSAAAVVVAAVFSISRCFRRDCAIRCSAKSSRRCRRSSRSAADICDSPERLRPCTAESRSSPPGTVFVLLVPVPVDASIEWRRRLRELVGARRTRASGSPALLLSDAARREPRRNGVVGWFGASERVSVEDSLRSGTLITDASPSVSTGSPAAIAFAPSRSTFGGEAPSAASPSSPSDVLPCCSASADSAFMPVRMLCRPPVSALAVAAAVGRATRNSCAFSPPTAAPSTLPCARFVSTRRASGPPVSFSARHVAPVTHTRFGAPAASAACATRHVGPYGS